MIKPITSRILARPIPTAQGTIIIPERYQQERENEPIEAEVVAMGHQNRTKRGREKPWSVQPGDRILFVAFMGAEVTQDGILMLVVKESDILAIL